MPSNSPSGPCRPHPAVAEAIAVGVRDDLPALMLRDGLRPVRPARPASRRSPTTSAGQGVPTEPDQVLITSGAQQALHLIGSQLGGPGRSVAMENPTYIGAIDAFRMTGNRLVPVPVDGDGHARRGHAACSASSNPVRLAYVVPTFQNPTGTVMSEGRRRELARLAGEHGFQVVEDLTPDLTLGIGQPAAGRRLRSRRPGHHRRFAEQARLGRVARRLGPRLACRHRPARRRQDRRGPLVEPGHPGHRRPGLRADRRGRGPQPAGQHGTPRPS